MPAAVQPSLFPDQTTVTRVAPDRNQWRFYRLVMWADLSGRVLLARRWAGIGRPGRICLESHPDAGAALHSLASLTHCNRRCECRDHSS